MAAYAAATSLETTIRFLKYRDCFWLDPVSEAIIRPVDKTLMFLQLALEGLDRTGKSKSRKKINALDGRIKEALWRFEDLLESHLTDQYLLNGDAVLFSVDLRELQHDVDSFVQEMDCMEKEYFSESFNLPEEEEKEEEGGGGGSKKWKMIGLSDQFKKAKGFLIQSHPRKHGYGLFGMAGVGKTTLAKELFEDPEIRSHYDHHVWIKVGRKYRPDEYYLHAILAQVDPTDAEGDRKYLKRRLKGNKCLVVLDDVWGPGELVSLLGPANEEMMASLTNKESGIFQILLTGRDRGALPDKEMLVDASYQVVRLMNDEESKDLLCTKVFGEGGVLPSRLEKAAKKIVKKCEGLPLLIVAVADRLSEGDMTEEYWSEVAEERNSVFMDALDEISKVLFPSYEYLPQRYKMFFLYLGVFPPDCEISPSKLMNMLIGEGWFLQYIDEKKFFREWHLLILGNLCLERYMVLFDKKSIYWNATDGNQIVKICRLHRAWRHLCQKEAQRNKFYQVLNRWADFSKEIIKGQRGLCLHNNMLFSIKDLLDSVQLNCSLSMRSLLCFGPYHQYPVPIHAGFKFLRELDALKLRFYTFPTEILQLVHLKYLALTCNGELPSTISKLFNLRVLIVHPHMDIKIRGAPSYIPVQIWDMPLLQHIEILGRSIQAPYRIASADNLSTLLGVNASTSNMLGLVEKFRVMIKLGVRIEVMPYDDDTNLLDCFHFISRLHALRTLKFSIVNPEINYWFLAPPTPSSLKFPYELQKLHLSGMGFPWEYMDVIASLFYLKVLKLRCYAFRGPKWDMKGQCFQSLEFLLIEDSDLMQWAPGPKSFPNLTYLSMKDCYKLRELSWPSSCPTSSCRKIELVDCNPLAVTCARQLQQFEGDALDLTITSSYGDRY